MLSAFIITMSHQLTRLKQIDIEFMRRLHTKVNLIPVIAKADTLTDEEIADFKNRVKSHHALQYFILLKRRYRFWPTLLTITFTFSKHLPTTTRMRRPLQRPRR